MAWIMPFSKSNEAYAARGLGQERLVEKAAAKAEAATVEHEVKVTVAAGEKELEMAPDEKAVMMVHQSS